MVEKLLDLATGKLLEKFGAGNHKPGSGSASAFQGLLAAQMLLTVIDLTDDDKRRENYWESIPKLRTIKNDIQRLYKELESLFQLDSEQFDKVIKLRELRDKESNPQKKRILLEEAREALKISTKTPLRIADLSLKLADFAMFVFDHGFKSARGDSGVALTSAVSAIASCLCIIELNLISMPFDGETEKMREDKSSIKSRYNKLLPLMNEKLAILEKESNENRLYERSIHEFQNGNLAESIRSNSELEEIVRRLQNMLWLQRGKIWKNQTFQSPLELLKPEIVLKKVIGYSFLQSNSLGFYEQDGDRFEIAGDIDKSKKLVRISGRFSLETQNFTAAHELGHSILHKQTVLHRDKPIDGPRTAPKSLEEFQADKFATYFLMPGKIVEETFFQLFEMQKFIINENSVTAIGAKSIQFLREKCQNLRGLGRLVASLELYAGKPFKSLSEIFGVSVETMAIRLEELQLIEF
jgi:formiminotetrahydrofolate cyclodeaminase